MSEILNSLKTAYRNRKKHEAAPGIEDLPLQREVAKSFTASALLSGRARKIAMFAGSLVLVVALSFFLSRQFFKRVGQEEIHRKGALLPGVAEEQPGMTEEDGYAALNRAGIASMQAGRVSEAIDLFEKAITQRDTFAPLHNNLGVAKMNRGEVDEAIGHFLRAVEIMPRYAEAHLNLAIAYESNERYYKSYVHYNTFLEYAPAARYDDLKARVKQHMGI